MKFNIYATTFLASNLLAIAKCPANYFPLTVDNDPLKACFPKSIRQLSDDESKYTAEENNENTKRCSEVLQELPTLKDA